MKDARILFDRVWKKFHRGQLHDSLRDLIPAATRRLFRGSASDTELHAGDFWAVRDLSFEVGPGQTLGIIGPNGSGKSTTLKILTRIMQPSRGYREIRGRAGTLIEVSAGFHGDLTGRENVFLQGAIMGMRKAEIIRKFDEIVEFSGVADAIDTPVKRYSSGMNARLGFSIAAHLEPDVLIIDEVLSVGDMSFQERAFGRIRDLATSGIPVIMVSHQLERIAELCTDAILLSGGEVVSRGLAADVIAAYVEQHDSAHKIVGTGVVAFESVRADRDVVPSGERVTVRIDGHTREPIAASVEPMVVRLRSLNSGRILYATGSRRLGIELPEPGPFSVRLELQANLPAGIYMLEVVASDLLTRIDIAAAPFVHIRVTDPASFSGTVQLNASMSSLVGTA